MDAVQIIPVVDVQSAVPHLQSIPAMLAMAPLVKTQVVIGRVAHVLEEAVQYNDPAVELQSAVPHEQDIALTKLPSAVVHGAALLQELMNAVQNNPVVEVQSAVPHLQSIPATLAVVPLVITQAVSGRVAHVLEEAVQYNDPAAELATSLLLQKTAELHPPLLVHDP